MSDETVIVREQGTIFLGGPPLARAATGETVSAEELGGGDVHSRVSGVADHLADDDAHALRIVRSIVATVAPAGPAPWPTVPAEEPAVDPSPLPGVVPADPRTPYDVREVIGRIVDGSRFHEFKERYGPTLVTGFAHVHGHPVGIVASNGILFSESAVKGAHFIELCDQRLVPLVFLIDPLDTRRVLGLALAACVNAPLEPAGYGIFRM
jgi:3-methylcrotonyl-CoA carboxylase beta subunit